MWARWKRIQLADRHASRVAPLLVAAALVADYATPAATWTLLPPLACVLALLALRRWAAAATIVVLSSWVLIPVAAFATVARDAVMGKQHIYAVGGIGVPGVDENEIERCFSNRVVTDVLEVPFHGMQRDPTFPERVVWSFAGRHNRLAVRYARYRGWFECHEVGWGRWSVLPQTEAQKLTRPCSREFPAGLTGFWTPDARDVAAAEAALPAAIEEAFRSRPPGHDGWRPNHYHRQYAGFLRAGRRVIYVNAVGHEIGEEFSSFMLGDLDTRAQVICDGGEITFGAVFDPQRGGFDSFAFNGAL